MLRLNNSATTTKNLKGWSYPLNKLGCLFRSGVYACFFKCFIYSCVVALDFCSKLQIIFSKDPLIITSAMWFIDFDWSDVEVHAPNLNSLNIYCLLEYWNMFWLLSPPPPPISQEYAEVYMPHRSTSYAPYLSYVDLEYCDHLNDRQLQHIVAVCGETLTVKDYYGQEVVPRFLWGRLYACQLYIEFTPSRITRSKRCHGICALVE